MNRNSHQREPRPVAKTDNNCLFWELYLIRQWKWPDQLNPYDESVRYILLRNYSIRVQVKVAGHNRQALFVVYSQH